MNEDVLDCLQKIMETIPIKQMIYALTRKIVRGLDLYNMDSLIISS